MSVTWIVLPGLAETPEEFAQVAALLPDQDVRIIDPWRTPVTSDVDALRAAAEVEPDTEIGLIGHSIGGLAGLRWALTRPLEVTRLVLVDSSLTSETGWRLCYPGAPGDRVIRSLARFLGRLGGPRLIGASFRWLSVRFGSLTRNEPLSKATIRARYGAADSWLLFWDELAATWELAAETAKLVAGPIAEVAPTEVLVATGGGSRRAAKRWLTGQQQLADAIGGRIEILPDSAHLVHLDRPDAIAAAVHRQ
ncbi:alpha/beta hydrolase [Kribbella solani]|uniref:alpha/beta hydrolase n=1 Tax=Kribbella solani TaxID=236067 RepID=UPI0029A9819C|nr:alpha/beta hydrolase [Kribbella solani]MDX2967670.1 alpha/beta hydrolase [Kribbella solani]